MGSVHTNTLFYVYNYACREDEKDLCFLEMRSLFGENVQSGIVESSLQIAPSRSPFIRERIDVLYEGDELQEIMEQVKRLPVTNDTFKVIFVKYSDFSELEQVDFTERRKIERELGLHIPGEPDLEKPDVLFGIMNVNGRWVFGHYHKNQVVWLQHQKKPNSYSTALSTRVARAIANIAVPHPIGIKAIDPCCGIGTVLVEALSMGIDIVGSDINPLVLRGARENLAHFGLVGEVTRRDMREISEHYDAAIIDMPYNIFSAITPREQLEMLESAGRFADKVVIVTLESIDAVIIGAGFHIVDRCDVKKGAFVRQVIVCEKILSENKIR